MRAHGYPISGVDYYNEQHDGALWGASVPIRGKHEVYGAFGIMLLGHVLHRSEGIDGYLPTMQQIAAEVAEALDS